MKTYTLQQFEADYPDEDACLEALFEKRFGHLKWCPHCGCEARFYRVKDRRCYACMDCRHKFYPTAGTVLHRTHIPLKTWFFVIYLFSVSRNGVASREVERLTGIAHGNALRMTRQIRKAMNQGGDLLSGTVEADEAYIGGRRRSSNRFSNKTPLLGAVERGGRVRVLVSDIASTKRVSDFIGSNVSAGSTLHTDESRLYFWTNKAYNHISVQHGKWEFVREDAYTNTMEGFWGNFKPYLDGTHRSVSKEYLQFYVNEAVWKYNHRRETSLFPSLLEAVAPPKIRFGQNVYVDS